MSLKMSGTAAIIGASGMLGRALQGVLAKNYPDQKVKLVDVKPHPLNNPKFPFFSCNIVTDSADSMTTTLSGVDTIYWVVTPPYQTATKKLMHDVNVVGLTRVLDAYERAAGPKPKRFVYTSSVNAAGGFYATHRMSEKDPIPDIKLYQSWYDITKRQGEEEVLKRNKPDFLTCSIRPNAIIGDHTDFFKQVFIDKAVSTAGVGKFDLIVARDLSKALIKAGEKLTSSKELPGKAIFITRSKYEGDTTTTAPMGYVAEKMGYKVTNVPGWMSTPLSMAMKAQYTIKRALGMGEDLATPPYMFVDLVNIDRTFDNSLGKRILQWEPEESWQDACDFAIAGYKAEEAKKGKQPSKM